MSTTTTKKDIYSSRQKPASPEVIAENIPQSMKAEPRWLVWDFVRRKEKWQKVPRDARTGVNANCNDAKTWCDFEAAYAAYRSGRFDGIGFALGDGWLGVDLDDCLQGGEFTQLARETIDELDTYTEISPSRTGVKMILKATLQEGHATKNGAGTIEVYSRARYFCITGLIENDNVVEERQEAVERVMHRHIGSQSTTPQGKSAPTRHRSGESDGVNKRALEAMLRIKPKEGESDSSNRLFAVACRAQEFGLSEKSFLETLACYELTHPFPKT